ncbi:hypothetical protein L150_01190 [Candida albicans Ca529L]|nr:hypothetical protein L150_01190 [Candida albicans Ca529L]
MLHQKSLPSRVFSLFRLTLYRGTKTLVLDIWHLILFFLDSPSGSVFKFNTTKGFCKVLILLSESNNSGESREKKKSCQTAILSVPALST